MTTKISTKLDSVYTTFIIRNSTCRYVFYLRVNYTFRNPQRQHPTIIFSWYYYLHIKRRRTNYIYFQQRNLRNWSRNKGHTRQNRYTRESQFVFFKRHSSSAWNQSFSHMSDYEEQSSWMWRSVVWSYIPTRCLQLLGRKLLYAPEEANVGINR